MSVSTEHTCTYTTTTTICQPLCRTTKNLTSKIPIHSKITTTTCCVPTMSHHPCQALGANTILRQCSISTAHSRAALACPPPSPSPSRCTHPALSPSSQRCVSPPPLPFYRHLRTPTPPTSFSALRLLFLSSSLLFQQLGRRSQAIR